LLGYWGSISYTTKGGENLSILNRKLNSCESNRKSRSERDKYRFYDLKLVVEKQYSFLPNLIASSGIEF